ncbi:hypothetical protein RB653_008257 [Dictyostelium firmibasis]|uniref:Uncharacterized protein n=1 Tax=Dictyostelium firmibasis TaxID=79012 RepID=A0AAN7YZM2_9MYCE
MVEKYLEYCDVLLIPFSISSSLLFSICIFLPKLFFDDLFL